MSVHVQIVTVIGILLSSTAFGQMPVKKVSPAIPLVLHERLQLAETRIAWAVSSTMNLSLNLELEKKLTQSPKGFTAFCEKIGEHTKQINEGLTSAERADKTVVLSENRKQIKKLLVGISGFCVDRGPIDPNDNFDSFFSENVSYGNFRQLEERLSRLKPLLEEIASSIKAQYENLHEKLRDQLVEP